MLTIIWLSVRSAREVAGAGRTISELVEITSILKLTDLSFSTDARYTRHPSQADLFSAFQDYPGSIEHFPSGSVVSAPDFSGLGTEIRIKGR